MKTFITTNGLTMVECEPLNFKRVSIYHGQEEPYGYIITVGTMSQMYICSYDPDKSILSIADIAYSSDWSIKFKVNSFEEASKLVQQFADGINHDMSDTIFTDKLIN